MNTIVTTYLVYVAASVFLTIWVGRTLFVNGRVFLLRVFKEDIPLTDSVNKLLLVGFYLVNFGYVSLALETAAKVSSWREAIELLSWKIGLVLCVLGAMHFFNLCIFTKIGRRAGGRGEGSARMILTPPRHGPEGPPPVPAPAH